MLYEHIKWGFEAKPFLLYLAYSYSVSFDFRNGVACCTQCFETLSFCNQWVQCIITTLTFKICLSSCVKLSVL